MKKIFALLLVTTIVTASQEEENQERLRDLQSLTNHFHILTLSSDSYRNAYPEIRKEIRQELTATSELLPSLIRDNNSHLYETWTRMIGAQYQYMHDMLSLRSAAKLQQLKERTPEQRAADEKEMRAILGAFAENARSVNALEHSVINQFVNERLAELPKYCAFDGFCPSVYRYDDLPYQFKKWINKLQKKKKAEKKEVENASNQ